MYWRLDTVRRWLILILFSTLALGLQRAAGQGALAGGQTANNKTTAISASPAPPDAPVITVNGICDNDPSGTAKPGECRIEITRAQFDELINGLNPNMDSRTRFQLAQSYPELLLFAHKAHELGLDQDASFQAVVKYSYLQGASRLLSNHFQQAANRMSDREIEQYYSDHREMFERVDLLRIFVPKQKGLIPDDRPPSRADAAQEAAMKAEAEKIQKKAAAGGNFATLEEETYKFVGDPQDSPDIKVGKVICAETPERYRKAIFELPVGKVSELVPAPDGWQIFRVTSKQTIPMSEARGLIEKLWVEDSTETLKGSIKAEFNSAYFNASSDGEEPNSAMVDKR
jgi:hypothetical protein